MSKWSNFYMSKMQGDTYVKHVNSMYKPFIDQLLCRMHANSVVGEMGCGIGTITKILATTKPGAIYHCIDKCNDQLDLTRNNISDVRYVKLQQADILLDMSSLVHYDVIHGHGVLEHFDLKDITKIVEAQRKIAKSVVHYVPGNKYKLGSFGDERLLSLDTWKRETNPSVAFSFNDDHDYVLIWE